MDKFVVKSDYKPTGDQPVAIDAIVNSLENGQKHNILLGVTGSGKTFTVANVIERVQRPTLVIAHNKTLAAQLASEFKEFFPDNAVEFFVSYYDYYQPEAYVSFSDTYIEKDASINDEIDEMRHSATASLLERDDVIVVASVSCIYGIGDPDDYKNSMVFLRIGQVIKRNALLNKLVELTYQRNDIDFHRGTFRVRGDIVEIIPSNQRENGVRIEFFGDEIDRIKRFDVLTGNAIETLDYITIWPATHFMTNKDKLKESIRRIKNELQERILYFQGENKPLEAERIQMRTKYDIEMLEEMGVCSGVENYSRHIALKEAGETPSTLIDFFNKDFMLIIDESHVTVSQVRGMYNGDRSRKTTLIDYGFRLPSALDNRPLKFEEFENKLDHVIYLSATPGEYELNRNLPIIEQIIRPTYLIDPEIEVRKSFGQIDDLYAEIVKRVALNERILVTTLTIKMSEDLTAYFKKLGMKVAYLHSEIKSLERIVILRDLRIGKYDVLIGINLLREGLDLPEVSLVAILDADKQGFLRSERSLIQTIGRAARNLNGKVIMYADHMSDAMEKAIQETYRRRQIQVTFNEKHGTVPVSIQKDIRADISMKEEMDDLPLKKKYTAKDLDKAIARIERDMKQAAKELNFELATELRDQLFELKAERGH